MIVFNIPGLLIACLSGVLGLLVHGVYELLLDWNWIAVSSYAQERCSFVFLGWGFFLIVLDTLYRRILPLSKWQRLFSLSGPHIWFLPCWLGGYLFSVLGFGMGFKPLFFSASLTEWLGVLLGFMFGAAIFLMLMLLLPAKTGIEINPEMDDIDIIN